VKIQVCAIKLAALLPGNSIRQNGADGHSGTISVAATLHFQQVCDHTGQVGKASCSVSANLK